MQASKSCKIEWMPNPIWKPCNSFDYSWSYKLYSKMNDYIKFPRAFTELGLSPGPLHPPSSRIAKKWEKKLLNMSNFRNTWCHPPCPFICPRQCWANYKPAKGRIPMLLINQLINHSLARNNDQRQQCTSMISNMSPRRRITTMADVTSWTTQGIK